MTVRWSRSAYLWVRQNLGFWSKISTYYCRIVVCQLHLSSRRRVPHSKLADPKHPLLPYSEYDLPREWEIHPHHVLWADLPEEGACKRIFEFEIVWRYGITMLEIFLFVHRIIIYNPDDLLFKKFIPKLGLVHILEGSTFLKWSLVVG